MRKENDPRGAELVQRIEQARNLLDEALALVKTASRKPRPSSASATKSNARPVAVDFSMTVRAFVKLYGKGMSGAKKFTLVVAYLTKGNSTKSVPLSEIEKCWNKMTAKGLLGMKFNRLYTSQAKEHDWTDTEKAGSYHLRPAWKSIFA